MSRTEEAQEIFDAVDSLRDRIRARRMELAISGIIQNQWPLGARSEVDRFISDAIDAAGLSPSQKSDVIAGVNERLNSAPGLITVSILEGQLLDLQRQINDELLEQIILSISEPGTKIQNATRKLKEAIESLEDLNKIFGAITIAVNLVSTLVAASAGNFGVLLSIIPQLLS